MIEFALGIIDGGRFVWAYNTVAFACREGTRYAIVRGAASSSPATAAQTSTWQPDNKPGSFVQVKVAFTFKPVTPVFTMASYQVASTSKMAISQ
ncbi:MAG: pilus assembly protein [Acidobacteriota bacterium]|nr:pilus assembly protein [Acidobacteriota bacterium]